MPIRRFAALFVALFVGVTLPSASAEIPHKRQIREEILNGDSRAAVRRSQVAAQSSAEGGRVQAENFRVRGHTELSGGPPWGDVFFYDYGGTTGKYAFVGHWFGNCRERGVQIIDVNDPSSPKVAAVAGRNSNVTREDIVVAHIGDRDVLAIGVQDCRFFGSSKAKVGLKLFDVTDPANPTALSTLELGREGGGRGVHELDLVVRPDGTALALLATPFTEVDASFGQDAPGEFRIVDVTDSENPVEMSNWGIIQDSSLKVFGGNDEVSSSFQGLGTFPDTFAHSVRAADGGRTAYVSYWDGGVLKFDISDPASPVLLGRTMFTSGDDGDAHSMTPLDIGGTRYILQNDEDEALQPSVLVSTSASTQPYPAQQQEWARYELSRRAGLLTGRAFHAGDGCQKRDFRGAHNKIVFFNAFLRFYGEKAHCPFGSQVARALNRNARAVVINMVWPEDPNSFFPIPKRKYLRRIVAEGKGVPILQLTDIDDVADDVRTALKDGPLRVTLRAQIPSWGFLRIFDESLTSDVNGDGTPEFQQVARFSDLLHVRGERDVRRGVWAIHNTEVNGDRAYSSWYSHGIVALDMSDPTSPQLAGQFVPPSAGTWGVAVDPDTGLVYASDIRTGLWILEPTGEAAAAP
jgi:hypothetical protein